MAPKGPFGAKEVGQGPLLPVMPAVANAVYDAIGVRIDEVPITPEKILKALESPTKRYGPKSVPEVSWPEPIRVPAPWEGGTGRPSEADPASAGGVRVVGVAPAARNGRRRGGRP